MFKKDIQGAPKSKLKSSVQRGLRQSLLATYPLLHAHIDEILPKKSSLEAMRLPDRVTLYVLDAAPLFFQYDNNVAAGGAATLLPHLRLVHRFPQAFPSVRIDRGAIRFVLSGATLMAPGLTSAGGRLPSGAFAGEPGAEGEGLDEEDHWTRALAKGEPAVVRAEGKTEACAVGFLVMGTDEVKEKGKGPVIEEAHYLGDGLWRLGTE
ncbi:PUA domain-containing protein [Xylariaceae sp. FL0804]|nr:PUA domain-containing protein [Xylariaceae sp. FL0804]